MRINFSLICASIFCTLCTTVAAGPIVTPEPLSVPEAGATGSIAALAAVAAVGAMALERRRRNRKD